MDLAAGDLIQTYQEYDLTDLSPVMYGGESYDGAIGTNVMYYVSNSGTGIGYGTEKVPYSNKVNCAGINGSGYWIGTWSKPDEHVWEFCLNANNQLHVVFDNATVGVTSGMNFTQRRETIQSWLQDNSIIMVLPLETPIRHQLSPQTLRTLHGVNNIWSNANGPVEVSYWTH